MFKMFKRFAVFAVVSVIGIGGVYGQETKEVEPKSSAPSASGSKTGPPPLTPTVVGAILGGLLGACGAYLVRRGLDRKALTIQQFQFYHSDAMIKARVVAWDYLKGDYLKDKKPMSYFYTGVGAKENETYSALIQVLNYWLLLCVLAEKKLVVPDLVRQLLRQNYIEWIGALGPLLVASASDKLDAHQLVKGMRWLEKEE